MSRTVEEMRAEAERLRSLPEPAQDRADAWEQTAEVSERLERLASRMGQLGSDLRRQRRRERV